MTLSRLHALIEEGHFVVCAEMAPPKGADPAAVSRKAAYFRDVVDAVNTTDNQSAAVRMSSQAAAALLVREGIEPIMQMTCRDRNRLGLQGDVLGAAALGVRNILCLTGDHQRLGDHPGAKGVFDLDSLQLIRTVRTLRDQGKLLSGDPVKPPPGVFVGAVENPFADPFEFRATRLAKKVAAGAEFIQTQAVFDIARFSRWMAMVRDMGVHERAAILAGVLPPRSPKVLNYMKREVSGVSIPDELIRRMESAAKPDEEGISICCELIERLREIPGVRGIHLMPVNWESVTPEIAKRAGLLPRPAPSASALSSSTETATQRPAGVAS
ncbi:MAG: methylenetetrahydrofolate reductase [Firmicutes bacterium]|nr:methylenetetrahydrofolate reductase [Bacillota bacterium]